MENKKIVNDKSEEKTFKYYLRKINNFDYSIVAGILFILLMLGTLRGCVEMFTNNEGWNGNYQRIDLNNIKTTTEDWKTYINEEYGFELKYPDGVTIEERENSILVWNKESKQKAQEIGTWIPEEFSISKVSNEQIVVTPEWLVKKDSGLVLQDAKELIGGKVAFVALPTEIGTKTYIVSTENGTFMLFAWGYENGKFYNDIIKTFKFTN